MAQEDTMEHEGRSHHAAMRVSACPEGHIHVDMKSICGCGTHCEDLSHSMSAQEAREMAMRLLELANTVSPPS